MCPFAFWTTRFGQEEIGVFKDETIVQHLSLSYGRTKSFPSLSFHLNIKLRCHKFCEKLIRYSQRNQSGSWFSGGSTWQKKTSFVAVPFAWKNFRLCKETRRLRTDIAKRQYVKVDSFYVFLGIYQENRPHSSLEVRSMSLLKKNNKYGEFIVILWCTKSQREQRGNGSLLTAAHRHLTVFPLTTK